MQAKCIYCMYIVNYRWSYFMCLCRFSLDFVICARMTRLASNVSAILAPEVGKIKGGSVVNTELNTLVLLKPVII